jgi:membrane protease YdiL (CAAX protease family)
MINYQQLRQMILIVVLILGFNAVATQVITVIHILANLENPRIAIRSIDVAVQNRAFVMFLLWGLFGITLIGVLCWVCYPQILADSTIAERMIFNLIFTAGATLAAIITGMILVYLVSGGVNGTPNQLFPTFEAVWVKGAPTTLLYLTTLCLAAPFIEEFLHRGIVYDMASKKLSEWQRFFVCVVPFAFGHIVSVAPTSFFYTFAAGSFYYLIRRQTGSFLLGAVSHALVNLSAVSGY